MENIKTKYQKEDITLNGIASSEKYFESTLKALIYSKKISGIKKAQLLSFKEFKHPDIECKILPHNINSLEEYNFFMMKNLYYFIDTNLMINIHNDGFIINPDAWIDDFLNFDYIGALWPLNNLYPPVTEKDRCGNGGFSLRSKRFLEISALYCPFYKNLPEDVTVCRVHRDIFTKNGMVFANDEIAAKFSIENQFLKEYLGQCHSNKSTLKTFGFHLSGSDAIRYLEEVSI